MRSSRRWCRTTASWPPCTRTGGSSCAACPRWAVQKRPVQLVALHREVHQAEPEALASARKRALQGAEAAMRPQIPDFPADADGNVERAATKLPARPVRNVLARGLSLAAGAPPGTAPARQWELLLDRVHSW